MIVRDMVRQKVNYVIIWLLIVILSHRCFSPNNENVVKKGTYKRKSVEFGESSSTIPPLVLHTDKYYEEKIKMCVEDIRNEFEDDKNFEFNIRYGMIYIKHAEGYYHFLSNHLLKNNVMTPYTFCLNNFKDDPHCESKLTMHFGHTALGAVKKIFNLYTKVMIISFMCPIITSYYLHCIGSYAINEKINEQMLDADALCLKWNQLRPGYQANLNSNEDEN